MQYYVIIFYGRIVTSRIFFGGFSAAVNFSAAAAGQIRRLGGLPEDVVDDLRVYIEDVEYPLLCGRSNRK